MADLKQRAAELVAKTAEVLLSQLEACAEDGEACGEAHLRPAATTGGTGPGAGAGLRKRGRDEVPKELLLALLSVFPASLEGALDLVDRGAITKLTSPCGRSAFQVNGSGGRMYLCLPDSNFCECAAYTFSVLKNDALMCKHVLATRIGDSLGKCEYRAISNQAFVAVCNPPPEDGVVAAAGATAIGTQS